MSWAEALEKENRKRTRPELQHLLLVFLTGFVTSSLLLPPPPPTELVLNHQTGTQNKPLLPLVDLPDILSQQEDT